MQYSQMQKFACRRCEMTQQNKEINQRYITFFSQKITISNITSSYIILSHLFNITSQMWYMDVIKYLYKNLAFDICYGILVAFCIVLHSIKQSTEVKNNLSQPTFKPFQSVASLSSLIQFLASFVSIGLWVLDTQFWVFWVFSFISFLCYGLLIVVLTQKKNDSFKLCCIPTNKSSVSCIRIFTVFANLFTAFYILLMLWIPCKIIDQNAVHTHVDNNTFNNCLYVIFSAFLCTSSFHVVGAIAEIVVEILYLSRRSQIKQNTPESIIQSEGKVSIKALTDVNKVEQVTVNYDVSNE